MRRGLQRVDILVRSSDSIPITEDEASEPKTFWEEEEEEDEDFRTLEESAISFQLNGSNERLSRK